MNNQNQKTRSRRNKFEDEIISKIAKDYKNGMHPDHICQRYAISRSTLYRYAEGKYNKKAVRLHEPYEVVEPVKQKVKSVDIVELKNCDIDKLAELIVKMIKFSLKD